MGLITTGDYIVALVFVLIIYAISRSIQNRNIGQNSVYKYYIQGLLAKLVGGVGVCLIYVYYYGGGDTVAYFQGGVAMANLMTHDFTGYLSIMGGDLGGENWSLFRHGIGWPPMYMWKDDKTFFVIRFVNILIYISGKTYLGSTVLLAWLSYFGIWKLFLLFNEQYPGIQKHLAIAILFMPSVVFWGSGMLKDTITFSAVCWFTSGIYELVVKRKDVVRNILILLISSFLMVSIKPYIFIAVLPGALIWISHERIQMIKSTLIKLLIGPVVMLAAVAGISLVLSQVQDDLGDYASVEGIMETATVIREDMLRSEQYGDNFFDIGHFDPSVAGLLSKAPIAISATMFRPFIWEAGNPVMLLSALENSFVLILSIFLLFRIRPIAMITYIGSQPLLLFSLTFALIFSFAVGLTTANFGALVRYKIPSVPFLVASLLILYNFYKLKNTRSVQ